MNAINILLGLGIALTVFLSQRCTPTTIYAQLGDWTVKSEFEGVARAAASVFTMNNIAYVGTGIDDRGQPLHDFWSYNSRSNSWTQKVNFPGKARSGAAGFIIGTKGYLSTGTNGGTCFSDLWDFDPTVH